MRQIRDLTRRAMAFYRSRGFWSFLKAVSIYLSRGWRFFSHYKEIVLLKGKTVNIKILYVDTIYTEKPRTEINIDSRVKAYKKVSTLMTFDYRKLAQRYGQSRMNEMLVKTAVKFKPDLIQLGKAKLIYGSTIERIHEAIDACVIHFYGDFRLEPQPWVVDIGQYADCTLFPHKEDSLIKKYIELGVKSVSFILPGTDPEKFYPRKRGKIHDIVFMANNNSPYSGAYHPRQEFVYAIAKKGFDLHLYGNGWQDLSDLPNVHLHPFVEEEEFAKACSAAKITFGVNGSNNERMHASWRRTLNSMASGAFHLTHYVPGLEDVFENRKHLVWFNSVPEAIELLDYYLAHDEEREKIAEAGRKEVAANHNWDIRIVEMLEIYRQIRQGKAPIPMGSWERWETDWSQERIDSIWRGKVKSKVWRKGKAYDIIAKLCAQYGDSVIDIGCGGGIQYAAIKEVSPGIKYTGVDITPKMLKSARELFPEAKFELGDAAHLPYYDLEFDSSIVRHVFEHHPLTKGREILHEALRVAKNAALLLFFIEPQQIEEDIIERKTKGFYQNIYSKNWLINEIESTLGGRCSIEIIPIPKNEESPALSDQVLYVIQKHTG